MTPQSPNLHLAVPGQRRRMIRRAAAVTAALLAVGGTPLVAVALGGDTDDAATGTGSASTSEVVPNWSLTDRSRPSDAPSARVSALETRSFGLELDADPLTADAADAADDEAAVAAEAAAAEEAAAEEAAAAEAAAVAAAEAEAARAQAVAAALADTYQWDERSPRVAALQQIVGAEADGWYAWATLRAHRGALEAAGLPTDALPVPPAPPAPAAPAVSSSGPSASAWAALRNCESGGNYSITNPSGKYRGAYQFDQSTWDSVARRHAPGLVGVDPAGASPSSQDAMAQALYSERGSDPWPQCGRHL
jgi:hypothetical protein